MTAKEFIDTLSIIDQEYPKGIPMKEIFSLAKAYQAMTVPEVIELLRKEEYNLRLGAVSILDWKARSKQVSSEVKKSLYMAYMGNHDWIDNWGLVDRAAPYVVGGYLDDKDKKPLYDLARSKNPMERRTAIVSTYFFIRNNSIEDTFNIAEILANDEDEYVQKAVGSWIREAGKKDEDRLKRFLDKFAKTLPRITLRYAIEKFDPDTRKYYLNMWKH